MRCMVHLIGNCIDLFLGNKIALNAIEKFVFFGREVVTIFKWYTNINHSMICYRMARCCWTKSWWLPKLIDFHWSNKILGKNTTRENVELDSKPLKLCVLDNALLTSIVSLHLCNPSILLCVTLMEWS